MACPDKPDNAQETGLRDSLRSLPIGLSRLAGPDWYDQSGLKHDRIA